MRARPAPPPRWPSLPRPADRIQTGGRRDLLGRDAARRQKRDPGGDDQRAAGAGELGGERLNGALVDRAAVFEIREVVDEGGVDHAVRRGSASAQTIEVLEIAPLNLGASRGERLRALIRAGKPDNLVARADKLLNHGGADKACGAGDEDTHESLSWFRFVRPPSRPRD